MDTTKHKLKKALGQNFLKESSVSKKMVKELDISKDDYVVEIGAGMGALTEVLADKVKKKKAKANIIEIDKKFFKDLKTKFAKNKSVRIVRADILDWMPRFNPKKKFKVIGSLPYYITSPILHSIVRHKKQAVIAVILIQKEVAEKISQKAPDASYLSTYLQTFYKVEIVDIVPKDHFYPEPKVDGAIIKMTLRKDIQIQKDEIIKYESYLHKGFSKPRKMMNKVVPKETLKLAGIDEKLRPQHLTIEQWIDLYRNSGAEYKIL